MDEKVETFWMEIKQFFAATADLFFCSNESDSFFCGDLEEM